MATRSSESLKGKSANGAGKVLGRSASTGRLLLKPASKVGTVSMRQAKTAVKRVLDKKH